MNEKEDIVTYILRVDEVVNDIRGLGEELDESLVVQKVLRSLLLKYDVKVFVIEETSLIPFGDTKKMQRLNKNMRILKS
jgi:hypothetical protein